MKINSFISGIIDNLNISDNPDFDSEFMLNKTKFKNNNNLNNNNISSKNKLLSIGKRIKFRILHMNKLDKKLYLTIKPALL